MCLPAGGMVSVPWKKTLAPFRPPAMDQEPQNLTHMYIKTLFGGGSDTTIGFSIKFWSTGQILGQIQDVVFSKQFSALYGSNQPYLVCKYGTHIQSACVRNEPKLFFWDVWKQKRTQLRHENPLKCMMIRTQGREAGINRDNVEEGGFVAGLKSRCI